MKLIKFYKIDRVTSFVILTFLILVLFSFLSKNLLTKTLFGGVKITPLDLTSDFYITNISDTSKTDETSSISNDSKAVTMSGVENNSQLTSEKGDCQKRVTTKTDQSFVRFEDYSNTNELHNIIARLKSLKEGRKTMSVWKPPVFITKTGLTF